MNKKLRDHLHRLVDQWCDDAELAQEQHSHVDQARADALWDCAEQIENVLDTYFNDGDDEDE